MGRIESEGLDDGFGLDDLRVELSRVDLREKHHYQILEERLQRVEGAIVLLMERSMGLRERRSEGPDVVSLNSDGGESAGGSGLPRREDEEDEEEQERGKGKGKGKAKGKRSDTDMD